jgi:hypothetical protein
MLSSGQEFDEKLLDSKHVLKVIFKANRQNKDFLFLPDPILPGWLRILHLKVVMPSDLKCSVCDVRNMLFKMFVF